MEQNSFDLGRMVALVKRYKWFYVLSLIFCLGLSIAYLYRTPKVYSINAQVLIADQEGGGNQMLKALSLGQGASVEDEVQVMDAHQLLTQAIRELGIDRRYYSKANILKTRDLYNNAPLKVMALQSILDTLSEQLIFKIRVSPKADHIAVTVKKGRFSTVAEAFGRKLPMVVNTPYGYYSIDTTKYYRPGKELKLTATVANPHSVAQGMDKLSVSRSTKKSNGITLYTEDNVTARGKDLLNKMIEIYNRWSQEKKNETARNTGKFIDERLGAIYAGLSDSEADIESFKRDNNITEPQVEVGLKLQRRQQVEAQLNNFETQNEVFKMIRAFVSDPKTRYEPIPFIEGANEKALESYNELILKRITLLQTAKPGNLAIETLDRQIDAMRQNVISTVDRVVASNAKRLEELKTINSSDDGELAKVPAQERQYRELMRQQTIKNELYSFLLEKREENQLLLAASLPKGQIIDTAYVHDKPVSPKPAMVIFLGIILGLLLPTAVLYIKSLLNNKFDNGEELSRLTSVPLAGEMTHSRRAAAQGLVIRGNSTDPVAELFRLMRSNIAFMLPAPKEGEGSVIAITSSIGHEGKSFIASNLAETLALMNKKVVLVGYDIRKPMLAKYLDLQPEPGITNYLSNPTVTIPEIVQKKADFSVIVAGPVPPNPTELLLGERTRQSIEELRRLYDYVILDTAPLGLVSDSFSLIQYADLTLYVTRAKYTLRSHIKMLNKWIADKRLGNVAVVVNDVHFDRNSGYGYGYSLDDSDAKKAK